MMLNNLENKRIALFGGSFNPIHVGHLMIGYDVIEQLGYDHIFFMPANIPVHKDFSGAAPALDRLNMVDSACSGLSCFSSLDIEIRRGGRTYTIDTVNQIMKMVKLKYKPGIIFGDDLVNTLDTWKNIKELDKKSDLICLHRESEQVINSIYDIKWVNNRRIDLSSTEIRNRIKKGRMIQFMVPDSVQTYIKDHNLYQ